LTTEPEAKGADARDFMPDGEQWAWDSLSLVQKRMSESQARFLAAYVESGTVAAASRAAGLSRKSYEYWSDRDVLGFRDRLFANKGLNPDKWAIMAPMPDSGSKELLAQVLKLSKKEAKREAVKELQERNEVEESVG
jgi:hypothetical protein